MHWLLTGKCPFWAVEKRERALALLEKELDFESL